jgi:hypothetical protein
MTWLASTASSLGLPASAAILATGMYHACAAAEKAARPEAIRAIGIALQNTDWSKSAHPESVIRRLFLGTFGERQWSLRCACRSTIATFVFIAALYASDWQDYNNSVHLWEYEKYSRVFVFVVPACLLTDFLCLWKARYLLSRIVDESKPSRMALLCGIDVLLSLLVGTGIWSGYFYLFVGSIFDEPSPTTTGYAMSALLLYETGLVIPSPERLSVLSSLLTSVWMITSLAALIVLKIVGPIQSSMVWFFNVQKKPLRAIGLVGGTLIMIGAAVWTLITAII